MTSSPSDPLGYYAVLGLSPDSGPDTIKTAFRDKAKTLHPDHNRSPVALASFQHLSEAYQVLSHAGRRADYDAQRTLRQLSGTADFALTPVEPVRCCACDRISAQPRFVIFHRVKSSPSACRREDVRGIFCRDCADLAAIKASTITWLRGWWHWQGPWHSLQALWSNLTGGWRPVDDNVRVLIHQCRAFLWRGQLDAAYSLAKHAASIARQDQHRMELTAILRAIGPRRRVLKNRWRGVSHAHWVQAGALSALVLFLAVAALLFSRTTKPDAVSAAIRIQAPEEGTVKHVAVDLLKVRQQPVHDGAVVALLDRFATVQVTSAQDNWAKVTTANGVVGFVPARYLFAGPGRSAKSRWCEDYKGDEPDNGAILSRGSGGDKHLLVRNQAGSDAVVRLKTPTGRTQVSLFIKAGTEVEVGGIPEGAFRAVFATGRDYSQACGIFLRDMTSYVVPRIQVFRAAGTTPELVLTPPGDGKLDARPIALQRYLDR